MTAAVMQSFGIAGIEIDTERIVIPVGTYQAQRYAIEPDASSASYPLAAVAICGGMIKIPGLKTPAIQGDIGFLNILRAMGVDVVADVDGVVVRSLGALKGVQLDLRDMSDLVPTVAALAVFADTPTEITGVGFIRLKESDRIGDLVRGLQAIGCDSSESADGLLINPVPIAALKGVRLATHHDHRLAMAWSLIALRVPGISIENPEVVSKSWPQWWAVRHLMVLSTSPTNSGQ
jgi:3-phosphoshikimate 1-carboxyvinyltransferase